jgi:aminoglycoside phosphotransferase (APT) family kinase protein
VPAFGIVAKGDATPSASLLDRVVGEIQASHPELGPLSFQSCIVTGKEKVVLAGLAGGQPVVLKIPASPEAHVGERNNRSFLDRLALHASVASLVPRPLAHGVHQNLPYFLETAANGVSLDGVASDAYRVAAAGETAAVLHRLRMVRVTRASIERNGDIYTRLVSAPLAKLRAAGIEAVKCDRLEQRLDRLLTSSTWPIGLSHGDFSMHNLFFTAHRVAGIIDWGDATFEGLPILDALAYVQSMQRKWSKKPRPRVGETLKRLSTWDWPSREEVSLLRRIYEESEIDIGLHAALCELCWLQHMNSQLESPGRFNRDAMFGKSRAFLDN